MTATQQVLETIESIIGADKENGGRTEEEQLRFLTERVWAALSTQSGCQNTESRLKVRRCQGAIWWAMVNLARGAAGLFSAIAQCAPLVGSRAPYGPGNRLAGGPGSS